MSKYFYGKIQPYNIVRNIFHLFNLKKYKEILNIFEEDLKYLSFISNQDYIYSNEVLKTIDEENSLLLQKNFFNIRINENIKIKEIINYLKLVLHEYFLYNKDLNETFTLVRILIYLSKDIYGQNHH